MYERMFGVDVTTESSDDTIRRIFSRHQNDEKSFIVAINPEKLMKSRKDPELREILNKATIGIPDGIGVLLASRLRGGNIRARITGVDMMELLCKEAGIQSVPVFLYGAKPGVAAKAAHNLQAQFPNLQVAGTLDGYVKDEEEIITTINNSGAKILFVALGSPTQENFIIRNMDKLNVSVFQGVGGSFDVFSGNIERAPVAFRRLGLEWFYRLLKEPSRWKRQLELPKFLLAILTDRKNSGGSSYE
ncbi:WecB/TagA/CpsF family glycosyltransferase [Sporosarcina ureilytica]|uniref:N-acetylglucosaminyldiphosphoundecaprenol N-acetyl-beta-D-mannosaminyltransferase n=1 Tax=Sporosarcina ureilytica TaxID=298596 RepID=A0A1D8JJB2_9BACL|nr:WecB/TagA/CpsF family glycosyltransferase [Sporosarcina ureilytica]AOV08797.1 glycosyltransferase [Sporosarcina ureilytica]